MELADLAAALSHAPKKVTLRLDRDLEHSEIGPPLIELLRQLEGASNGQVQLSTGHERHGPAAGVTITGEGTGTARYCAVPAGPEARPFAELLLWLARAAEVPPPPAVPALQQLQEPAEVMVLVAAACAHCPTAVRNALVLAMASPLVTVTVLDVAAHGELAARYRIRSVPMTVLDDELLLTGITPVPRLTELLLQRGSAQGEQEILAGLLKAGNLEKAGKRLQRSRQARIAFTSLWRESGLETRMGLTLAADTALETAADALDDLVDDLLPMLGSAVVALRGDTVDLLGCIAHPRAISAVAALLDDSDTDVVEAADEALSRMRQRRREMNRRRWQRLLPWLLAGLAIVFTGTGFGLTLHRGGGAEAVLFTWLLAGFTALRLSRVASEAGAGTAAIGRFRRARRTSLLQAFLQWLVPPVLVLLLVVVHRSWLPSWFWFVCGLYLVVELAAGCWRRRQSGQHR